MKNIICIVCVIVSTTCLAMTIHIHQDRKEMATAIHMLRQDNEWMGDALVKLDNHIEYLYKTAERQSRNLIALNNHVSAYMRRK